MIALLAAVPPSYAAPRDPAADIKAAIDPIVAQLSKKYDCAISVALRGAGTTPLTVASTAGAVDKTGGRAVAPADGFVWGSITKMVTGASVLRLVDQQKLALTDAVAPIIDPFLAKLKAKDPAQNFSKLSDLWGDEVSAITVLDLLAMRSGVPDYDTASPSGRQPSDSFRADACAAQFAAQFSARNSPHNSLTCLTCFRRYAHPSRSYSPTYLLSLPWVATGSLQFSPGACDTRKYYNCYSSSNFVLLGLLLAQLAGADDWTTFAQQAPLAPAAPDFTDVQFAVTGAPAAFTPVKGYDTTHYNNNTKAIDVSSISGVFGGWTAADFVAPAADAAALAQDLYGPSHKLVSAALAQRMYDESSLTGYGLATFNLTRLTPHDVAMGHLGATYGYQSVVAYVPKVELAVAVGTNIERDEQDQPADVFCHVYNTAAAILQGLPVPTCTYSPGYWSGGCKCH